MTDQFNPVLILPRRVQIVKRGPERGFQLSSSERWQNVEIARSSAAATLEQPPQIDLCLLVNTGRSTLARTGDVDYVDGVFREPLSNGHCLRRLFQIDDGARFAEIVGQLLRQRRPTGWRTNGENECRIADTNIPLGAHGVLGRRCFPEWVTAIDRPILGFASARTPPPATNAEFQRRIECRAIDAGLSAGDELFDRHVSLNAGDDRKLSVWVHGSLRSPRRVVIIEGVD